MDEMIETLVSHEDAEILNLAKARGVKTAEDFEDLAGPSFFISIPSPLLMRTDISPEAKIIYAMIIGLTRVKGKCNPTNEYLSKLSGIPERSIRRALVLLYKASLVGLDLKKNEAGTWRYLSPLTAESLYANFPGLAHGGRPIWPPPAGQKCTPRLAKLATQNNKEDNNKETTIVASATKVVDNSVELQKQQKAVPVSAPLPYVLKDDLARVICAWKISTGFLKDDRTWDKAHWRRNTKPARELLDFLGTWQAAADCIQDTFEDMKRKNLGCTLETVMKHSADWKLRNMEMVA